MKLALLGNFEPDTRTFIESVAATRGHQIVSEKALIVLTTLCQDNLEDAPIAVKNAKKKGRFVVALDPNQPNDECGHQWSSAGANDYVQLPKNRKEMHELFQDLESAFATPA